MVAITLRDRTRAWRPAPIGIAFTLSWIAGLAIPAPSPRLNASGDAIRAALAGHGGEIAANFLFTEGLPAIGLAAMAVYLSRAGVRWALWAGCFAAAVSVAQFALGVALARTGTPVLYEAVNRLDGVKMLALAIVGLSVAASPRLPRWLRGLGAALGVAITASGIAYLFLLDSLAGLAYVSGVLLLIFIPAAGIVLGRACRERA
jgi:hypothetical protein